MSKKDQRANEPVDPFQVWREWLDRSERQWNSWLNEAMESEQFSRGSGKLLETMLGFQSAMNAATSRTFNMLNLPSRTDVLEIGQRLAAIEQRLGAIEQAMSAGDAGRPAHSSKPAKRPKRTRKPPSKGDGK